MHGYHTGAPVAEVVPVQAHMPTSAGPARERAFVPPQKCIHSKADLDRCLLVPLPTLLPLLLVACRPPVCTHMPIPC